jgi:hypothetical protein
MQQQPKSKKRATGIPRTFLNETAKLDGEEEEGGNDLASTLVTNQHAFQTLVARSGGQSTNDSTHNLSYALKLTSTALPDHLTCGICHSLVVNAMLVPWDESGRSACESCIRDGLLQNGYKCPMTGTEGVSPEDLFPNVGLRKAAEAFEKSVWEKMAEMERQIEEEAKLEEMEETKKAKEEEFEDVGDGIVKRGKKEKKRKIDSDFGEDEFGGDVFDVTEEVVDEEDEEPVVESTKEKKEEQPSNESNDNHNKLETKDETNVDGEKEEEAKDEPTAAVDVTPNSTANKEAEPKKREAPKRRGPPAGYVLGPAGGGAPVMFGVNVPPPPPPPPRTENKEEASANGSRSGSVDLSSVGQGNDALPTSPLPTVMGRGRGGGDGRFSGRSHDYSRGGFQGRGRYNDNFPGGGRGGYQDYGGRGRGYQGRGGYGRGGPPQNQNWVSCC